MAAQGIDKLRALSNHTLMRSEYDSTTLRFCALHCHKPHCKSQRSFRDGLCISTIVLLTFYKRLYESSRHKPNLMTVTLCNPGTVTRGGTSLHYHNAGRLVSK